jgi:hypothetical protein
MLPLENELETILAKWLSTLHADVYHVAAIVEERSSRSVVTLWNYPPPPPAQLEIPYGAVAILGALRQIHTPEADDKVRPLPIDGFCGLAISNAGVTTGFYSQTWTPHITPDENNASLEWVISRYKQHLTH